MTSVDILKFILITYMIILLRRNMNSFSLNGLLIKEKNKVYYNINSRISLYFIDIIENTSFKKFRYLIYALSFFILWILSEFEFPKNNQTLKFMIYAIGILFLTGVIEYLLCDFDDIISYFLKLLIFSVYPLIFFMGFLNQINSIKLLLLLVIITILFSFFFLKGVIDSSRGKNNSILGLFFIINLIIVYIYDLILFGLSFGLFYLNNNKIFKLFNQFKINEISFLHYINIIKNGLKFFFNYPEDFNILIENSVEIKRVIPFFQFLLGDIFHIVIIAFFISYISSKSLKKFGFKENN